MQKRLIISASALVISTLIVGDASGVDTKRVPLKRMNSQMIFPLSERSAEQVISMKEEYSKFMEANKIEEKEEIEKDIQDSENRAVISLLNVGGRLGFKHVTLKNGKELELLDISWPTIKEYAKKVISEGDLPAEGNVEKDGQPLNLRDLETLMPLISDIGPAKDNNEEEDRTATNISDEVIQKLLKFCLGKNRLFSCDHNIERKVKDFISACLENYSSFQRIASMLVVSTLNLSEKYGFVKNHSFWRIIQDPDKSAYCHTILGNIVVPLEMKYEDGITFIHEIGHAYDAMLFEGIGRDNKHNISLETYSIINSDSADFASLFFPNLAPSVFDNATEKLEKIIDNILDIEAIRKDIKEHIDFGYDFKIRSSRIVFNMFKKLQLAGFGSRIFDLDTFKNPEDYRFDSEKTLTKKNIARALYIVCAYMRKGIEGNAYKYLSDGKFFSFGENESAESIWDGTMEMLTMIGVVPYVIDGRTFVINDKQNEFIAAKRSQIVEKDIESEQDLNVYRFHLLEHDKKVLDSLKVALSDIKMRGDVDEQSLKDIDHIEQPSEMMHLSTEYVENEMAFVNSEQAAQLLMKKNNEIRDEGAYSDYAGLNPASFSYSQRSSDFKHNCISNAQVPEGALELAVLRKDIPGIIQALQKTTDLTVIRGKDGNHWMEDILCGATPERTTVLHLAVANGDFEVVKTILDHIHTKIDDVLDSDGRTPLHFAVITGNWDITKLLLERGATDKFNAINMRASEERYWHRQFSLPRLSLNPIYNCSLYADQNMMDSGLETIGVHIPKDKIATLQQKLRTDTLVTTDDLDTILVDVNASIPAIRKRQNEWNGIGHIYYLMIYTSDISYTNRQMLYDMLKMSDARIDEEDLVINLLSLSKSQEEIDQVFASHGIDLPKEKIKKIQQKLQSDIINISGWIPDLKISGTDDSSLPIEKRILIDIWNKSFVYQYLYRFTDGILKENLTKLYGALLSPAASNNTFIQNYIDHLERDSHTGFVLPRVLIKRVQAKLQSQQKITEEDLKSIYINESKIKNLSSSSEEFRNSKLWNGMGVLVYLLEFTDNISEVNRSELLRLLNSATPPFFRIDFEDFSEQYKLAWLRYLSPSKWNDISDIYCGIRWEVKVLYKKLMEDGDLSTFRDFLLGNLKDTDDVYVAYLRMYDCSRDWSEKDADKIWHMRWNKFKSEYGAKQNHKDRIKAYEEKYGTIIKKNLEKMKSDPSFRKEWEVIRNMLSYLVLNKETILPKRVHFMKNHLCLDLD